MWSERTVAAVSAIALALAPLIYGTADTTWLLDGVEGCGAEQPPLPALRQGAAYSDGVARETVGKEKASTCDTTDVTPAYVNIFGEEHHPALRERIFFSPNAQQLHHPRHKIYLISGGTNGGYRDLVVPNHQGVAYRLGYNYSFSYGREPPKGYNVYWNKVMLIQEALARSEEGSYVVWIDDDMVLLPSDALEVVIGEHPNAAVIVSRDSYERALVNTGTLIVKNSQAARAVLHKMLAVGVDAKYSFRGKLLSQCTQDDGCFSEQDALRAVILARTFPPGTIEVVEQRLINTFARPNRYLKDGVLVKTNDQPSEVWGVGSPMGQCTGLEVGRVRATCLNTLLDVAAEVTRVTDRKGEIIPYGEGAVGVYRWWVTGIPKRLRGRLNRPWERLFRGSPDVAVKVRDVKDAPRRTRFFPSKKARMLRCAGLRRARHALLGVAGSFNPYMVAGVAPWGFGLEPMDFEDPGFEWGMTAEECLEETPVVDTMYRGSFEVLSVLGGQNQEEEEVEEDKDADDDAFDVERIVSALLDFAESHANLTTPSAQQPSNASFQAPTAWLPYSLLFPPSNSTLSGLL